MVLTPSEIDNMPNFEYVGLMLCLQFEQQAREFEDATNEFYAKGKGK